MVTIKRKICILIFIILVISCSRDKNKLSSSQWITYKNLEAGFELKIPKIGENLSQQEFNLLKNKLKKLPKNDIEPLKIYIDRTTGNSCLISKLINRDNIQNIIKEYKHRIKKNLSTARMKFSKFTYNNIKFYQFKIITKQFINLKLLFSVKKNNFIQIDYTLSNVFYGENYNKIVTSIRTIKRI